MLLEEFGEERLVALFFGFGQFLDEALQNLSDFGFQAPLHVFLFGSHFVLKYNKNEVFQNIKIKEILLHFQCRLLGRHLKAIHRIC